MQALRGLSVSPGYANGRVVVIRQPELSNVKSRSISSDEIKSEFKRFSAAVDRSVAEIYLVRQQVAGEAGESEAMIFDAHIAILSDDSLKENIRCRLETNLICAEAALATEMQAFSDRLGSSKCDYMHELTTDIKDIGNRLLRHLSEGEGHNSLAELEPDSVIFTRDLMPSETVSMDLKNVSGIATENGGPTSHASILARSLGIPAVTGLTGLLDQAIPGSICLLDGIRGSLILEPTDGQRRRFSVRRREFEQSQQLMRLLENRVCRLKNGTRIQLRANINQKDDVELAQEHNLDGIGLFRTELMYLSAHAAPTPHAQSLEYNRAAAACSPNPVTIRTFDFSTDKLPAFLPLDAAALELRGLRFSLHHRRLFKSQLRAIARSSKKYPNIRILFPMVTDWWELQEALELVKQVSIEAKLDHPLPVGAMIETPSAVFALPEIIKLVDFIAIGSNDLAQYTLAEERNSNGKTISRCALHPCLLRAIHQIAETASRAGCPVSLCGEAASDPMMAAIFTGLGIREFSVSPARAGVVRYALRHLSLAEARKIAECALQADPAHAMQELQAILPPDLKSILAMEAGVKKRSPRSNKTQESAPTLS